MSTADSCIEQGFKTKVIYPTDEDKNSSEMSGMYLSTMWRHRGLLCSNSPQRKT